MEMSNKLLKIEREMRLQTYPTISFGVLGRKVFNPHEYKVLERESLRLQEKIGLENEKSIAKELGLPDKLHYAVRRRLIRVATQS